MANRTLPPFRRPLRGSSPAAFRLAVGVLATVALATGADGFASPALAENRQFTGAGLATRTPQLGALDAQTIQQKVGFEQRLGETLPLELGFRDESGKEVRLGDYFGSRPVLLSFVYFRCPVLCPQILIGTAASLKALSSEPGREYEIVFVSFDPQDTPEQAAAKKAEIVERYGRPETAAGWHFLTGDEVAIARLTEAAGFRFAFDPTIQQFAHASGLVVATPDGKPARYLYGVEYAPKDLKLALSEASQGKVGGLSEKLMLLCFNYDAALGKYTVATLFSIKVAGAVTLAALIFSMVWMLRSERRPGHAVAGGTARS